MRSLRRQNIVARREVVAAAMGVAGQDMRAALHYTRQAGVARNYSLYRSRASRARRSKTASSKPRGSRPSKSWIRSSR